MAAKISTNRSVSGPAPVSTLAARAISSCSDTAAAQSITMALEPRYSPEWSYQRATGVDTDVAPGSAASRSHSASRSLVNTPLPGGGSPRRMKVSSAPSRQRTRARVLIRLYPPVMASQAMTRPARSGSTAVRNRSNREPSASMKPVPSEGDQRRVGGLQVVQFVEGMDNPPAVTGQDPAHRGVRGPEEHVLAQAEQMADVGVDDAAVTDDRELPALVQGQDAFDHGDHPVPELGAALRERRHVPPQLAVEPLPHAVPHHWGQDVLQPHAVGHVPVRLHLAQLRVDDGFQAVRGRDLTRRFDGPLQVAAQHGGDRLVGQRLAHRGRLPPA